MTPLFGVDWSLSKPDLKQLPAAGVKFVCRYLSTPGNPKNLTAAEAIALRALGLSIVVVFETTATRATAGMKAGVADAQAAEQQALACGLPNPVIYFACDFDIQDYAPSLPNTPANGRAKLGPVAAYFDGVNSVLGVKRSGAYGGFWAIRRLFDAGLISYGWQTYAWSGATWDQRAQIQQYDNGKKLAGGEVDFNRAMAADYGQTPGTDPNPIPKPVPVIPKPDLVALRGKLREWVLWQKSKGLTWTALAKTDGWKFWRRLGGK